MDQRFGDMSRYLEDSTPYNGLSLADIRPYLEMAFLHQLRKGAIFHLQHETKPGFLKLITVARKEEWLQVEFQLPDEQWSHEQFDQVHAAMLTAGHTTHLEENPRVLRVPVEGKWNELASTLIKVLELAATNLGFETVDRFTLRMAGSQSSYYRRERTARFESVLNKSPRGLGCIGGLLSALMHGVDKLDEDKD